MKFTVLIVDDVPINVEILKEILTEAGYRIVTATSGDEAIKKMEVEQPDLVLLDLYMPGMDGFEVQRYAKSRQQLSNIPIIFVTGEQDEEAEEKGLELGAVDYIRKPFNADIVCVKVRNHIELKAYRDKLEIMVDERTRQLAERTRQLAMSREAIIMGMSLMAEIHDKITGEHIHRIKALTKLLTNELMEMYPDMLTPSIAEQIVLYSPLHDVGKVGISDTILNKPGGLTSEEFEIMKSHTLMGGDILLQTQQFLAESSNDLQVAIDIANGHHERFDGTGYPHKKAGEDIPVAARIVALADVYDALRSPRAYKKAFAHEETFDIICVGDGRTMPAHFDPRLLEAFNQLQPILTQKY